MVQWAPLLLLAGLSAPAAGQGGCGRGATCRSVVYCMGDFDTIQEMEDASCRLDSSTRGLCCKNGRKKPAPPRREIGISLFSSASVEGLPDGLSDNIIGEELRKQPGLSAPVKTDSTETNSHRLFTQGRKEFASIRLAALQLLKIKDNLQSQSGGGISLRSYGQGDGGVVDADNSDVVNSICPWTNKFKPVCGEETKKYRTVNGSCNNPEDPLFGMSGTPLQRIIDPGAYSADNRGNLNQPRKAKNAPREELPSARLVTTTAFTTGDTKNRRGFTTLYMQIGQFIDHDITHMPATAPSEKCCKKDVATGQDSRYPTKTELETLHPDCFPIEIPRNDPFWGPKGRTCMEFTRADASLAIPTCSTDVGRNPMNAITHWLDASNVYGSTEEESHNVRDQGNRLHLLKETKVKDHAHPLLPSCTRAPTIEACEGPCHNSTRRCAFAGDFRVNEQPGLSSTHTLWFREHNRVAKKLLDINPHKKADLERVFQEAKKIVVATWQNIVMKEWVSIAVGPDFMRAHGLLPLQPGQGYTEDYDSNIAPMINAEFSGAAFRFGHSMVPSLFPVKTSRGRSSSLKLKEMFFNPSVLQDKGAVDDILLGLNLDDSPDWDAEFSNDLTNHLFEESPGAGGLDLVSLNIQRGRDLGLPGYNSYRKICASKRHNYNRVETFEDLTKGGYLNDQHVETLKSIYEHVDDIDLFVGGTLEGDLDKGLLGPAFACIIGDQFLRFKRGDKFWFENGDDPQGRFKAAFTEAQVDSLRGTSMARVMCDNTEIGRLQPMAFRTASSFINPETDCRDIHPGVDLDLWQEWE